MKIQLAPGRASVSEIFSSIQGEGLRMGERHIFIRFAACHMACAYCDEAGKKGRELSLPEILRRVEKLEREKGPHVCVSLTGGEPLLHADFLKPLIRALKKKGFRVLLETSGILWRQLSKVVRDCDIIAMDLKLSSVTLQKDFLEEHRKFLRIAISRECYIKIVVSRTLDRGEFDRHLRMVAAVAPKTPVFLQPVYETGRGSPVPLERPVSGEGKVYPPPALMRFLDDLQRIGARRLSDVRVGIQLHKLMNIR
jgi:organic radical activating enzyme